MSDLVSPGFVKDALNVGWVEVPGGVLIRGTPADAVDVAVDLPVCWLVLNWILICQVN